MKRNLIAIYEKGGEKVAAVYVSFEEYHKETFSPYYNQLFITDFVLHGMTYKEKKAAAVSLAIDLQNVLSDVSVSWLELAIIGDNLKRIAQRYGLVKEFQENGII